MSGMVKITYEAALEWQRHVVWIRINAGFITAEEEYIRMDGDPTGHIQRLLEDLKGNLEEFGRLEMQLFTLARKTELKNTAAYRNQMIEKLEEMKWVFKPWFQTLNSVIEERRIVGHDLGLSLLLCCGAEMLNAHTAFRNAVDDLIGWLDPVETDAPDCTN